MKPYFETEHCQIYHGHVLEVLKSMPDESVHCCVTSPPYWGLRDYGIEPQVWDDRGNCEHVWGNILPPRGKSGWDTFEHKYNSPGCHATVIGSKMKKLEENQNGGTGQFCQLCGAWRGSLGLEPTPNLFVSHIVQIFREVRRVLRKDGTCWVNLGDSYASGNRSDYGSFQPDSKQATHSAIKFSPRPPQPTNIKPKDLVGIPWMVAFALRADSWYLRSDIIWHKPNPMPESCKDRPTKAHEYLFLLSKSQRYYYDCEAIREPHKDINRPNGFKGKDGIGPRSDNQGWSTGNVSLDKHREYNPNGRNKRSVWTIATEPTPEAHFATFPRKLVEPCILAGCPKDGTVLDPFFGSGTVFKVAYKHGRKTIGIELSKTYLDDIAIPMIKRKTKQRKLF